MFGFQSHAESVFQRNPREVKLGRREFQRKYNNHKLDWSRISCCRRGRPSRRRKARVRACSTSPRKAPTQGRPEPIYFPYIHQNCIELLLKRPPTRFLLWNRLLSSLNSARLSLMALLSLFSPLLGLPRSNDKFLTGSLQPLWKNGSLLGVWAVSTRGFLLLDLHGISSCCSENK